jgi:hypothetical protein
MPNTPQEQAELDAGMRVVAKADERTKSLTALLQTLYTGTCEIYGELSRDAYRTFIAVLQENGVSYFALHAAAQLMQDISTAKREAG